MADQKAQSVEEQLALLEDIKVLVSDIHGQRGDDRCWMDLKRLFALCGLPPADMRVGDKFAMLKNCVRFVEHVCEGGGPWVSYAELEQQLESAKNEAKLYRRGYDAMGAADISEYLALCASVRGLQARVSELE